MKRILPALAFASLGLLTVAPHAQAQGGLGIFGGLTVPFGDYKDLTSQGWNGGAFLDFAGRGPLSLRFEGAYHGFGDKDVVTTGGGSSTVEFSNKYSLVSATANLRLGIPVEAAPIQPYVIGGIGGYHVKNSPSCISAPTTCSGAVGSSLESSDWNFGVNGGAGLAFGRGFSFFVEARYHMIFDGVRDAECFVNSASCSKSSAQLVPITVGFTFRP